MANFYADPEQERRSCVRKAAGSPAWADPGGILPVIDCRILDLTDEGARVLAPQNLDMPPVFHLQIDATRSLGVAEVVWRDSNRVGVKFLSRL